MTRFECIEKDDMMMETVMMELKNRAEEKLAEMGIDGVKSFLEDPLTKARIEREANERFEGSCLGIVGEGTPEGIAQFIIDAIGIYATACVDILLEQEIIDYLNEEVE